MYTGHYNLAEPPFSIAPDPRYLYLTAQHREALAHLLYGIGVGGGFVVLTGEVGTGKTTLCRCLLEQLPEDVDLALIFNPCLDSRELVAAICDELRIAYPGPESSLKPLIDVLNRRLLETHAAGRRTIVLIDEAQNLSHEVLEQIRLLTNLETNRAKLLQIILVGQPELNVLLGSPNLRQLAQRITARYHLKPLSRAETADYIRHRLAIAGVRYPIFTKAALGLIHRVSGGIPRRVNILCDRALLGAYSLCRYRVSRGVVARAARELQPPQTPRRLPRLAAAAVLGSAAAGLAYFLWPWHPPEAVESAARLPETPAPGPGQPASGGAAAEAGGIPAPAVEEGARKDFAERLAAQGMTREEALARVLEVWKLPPPAAGVETCAAAEAQGVRCLAIHGTWLQLRSLNLPAMLELMLPNGEKRYAALLAIPAGQAEIALGGEVRRHDPAEFLPYWRGDAMLLWRPPPGGPAPLTVGMRSEAVAWVRERLPAPAAPGQDQVFDPPLRDRVLEFQRDRGLAPDGVVGAQTMIHLGMQGQDGSIPWLTPGVPRP
jgi:general secretion pathway protein A